MICAEWIYSLGQNSFAKKKSEREEKKGENFSRVPETTGQLGQSDTLKENAFNCETKIYFYSLG